MHFLFNKDNSHCFHTEDPNDPNLELIADPDKNFYIHLPDFDYTTHPDDIAEDDICCLFYDPDLNTTYLPTNFFVPGYTHAKKRLEAMLREIVNNNGGSIDINTMNEKDISILFYAQTFLEDDLYNSIVGDAIITSQEAIDILDMLDDGIDNESAG
jgi:hypothetical protein